MIVNPNITYYNIGKGDKINATKLTRERCPY